MLASLIPTWASEDRVLAEDDKGEILLYGELPALLKQWKHLLPERCLVALLCANTVEHLRAYLGLHAAGHVVILLPHTISKHALTELQNLYQFEAIVKSNDNGKIDVIKTAKPQGGLAPNLSICLSTSGSTGSPKLVRYDDKRLKANAKAIQEYLGIHEDDVGMLNLPFEYSYGMSILHSHIIAGAKVLLTKQSIVERPFWEKLREASNLSGVPYHYEMLLRIGLAKATLPKLRYLTQAGGHLSETLVQKIHGLAEERGWKFHVMYGQTEAGPRISWLPHELVPKFPDCIGQPIPGVQLSIQDGELLVHSPSIMLGYGLNRADLAKGDELHGQLLTGDLAEEVSAGIFRINGRKNRFLKIMGNRISLSDVEAKLASLGHTVYCVGEDDKLLLCSTNKEIEAIRLAAVSLFSLPTLAINVLYIEELPRTNNGKVDLVALTQLALRKSNG